VEKGLRQLRDESSRDPEAVVRSSAEDIHSYVQMDDSSLRQQPHAAEKEFDALELKMAVSLSGDRDLLDIADFPLVSSRPQTRWRAGH